MKSAHRPGRLAAVLLAARLAGAGLTLAAAPAAHAAASDAVAKLPIASYSALAVDSAHQRVYAADSVDSYDPGDNTAPRTGWQDHGKLQLEAGAGDRLLMGQPLNAQAADPFLAVYDASGQTLCAPPGGASPTPTARAR